MNTTIMSLSEGASQTIGATIHPIHEWGIAVIHAVQNAGGAPLLALSKGISFVGSSLPYVILISIMYWCIDERRGYRAGLTLFFANGINVVIKESIRVPRPFYHDPSIKTVHESGWSTPSGHSQNSSAFWPVFLANKNGSFKGIRIALAILLPLCIGLSRIVLGVHYPTDVFLGWFVGALIAVTTLFILPRILAQGTPLNTLITNLKERAQGAGKSIRSLRLTGAALIAILLNIFSAGDSSMGGILFGFAAGRILLEDSGKSGAAFKASEGSIIKKLARLALGLTGLGLIYLGLKIVLPGADSQYYSLCRFLRYGLTGFWATWAAPRLFILTGLSQIDQ